MSPARKANERSELRSIHVDILGRSYPLLVRPEDERAMRDIASYVQERLQSIRAQLLDRPELTVAVVGALSIAEELFSLRRQLGVSPETIDAALDALSAQLEVALTLEGVSAESSEKRS